MNQISVTIPVGQTTSTSVVVPEGETICALSIRAAGFTGATVSFEISFDNGTTWLAVQSQDGATAYSVTVGATARFVPVNPNVFLSSHSGYSCLVRVVSASAELTNNKLIFLHTKSINN
jgi:hypothetical protein